MESGKIMEDPVLYNTDFHHTSSSVSKMHFSHLWTIFSVIISIHFALFYPRCTVICSYLWFITWFALFSRHKQTSYCLDVWLEANPNQSSPEFQWRFHPTQNNQTIRGKNTFFIEDQIVQMDIIFFWFPRIQKASCQKKTLMVIPLKVPH